jgi:hypothetical protein
MSSEEKSYFKITELSREFDEWEATINNPAQTDIQIWQVKMMLAIAQQLTMVAKHLGKIVSRAEVEALKNDTH